MQSDVTPSRDKKYCPTHDSLEPMTNEAVTSVKKEPPAIIFPWHARAGMIALFLVFIFIGATYYWVEANAAKPSWALAVMTILWLVAGLGTITLMYWVWREFTHFGNDLSTWIDSLQSGNLSERMPVRCPSCPSYNLRQHLNSISGDYQKIAARLERRLNEQELYIKQKQHYLSVLYDVASCINRSHSLNGLFTRFLATLKEVVNAESATVKLLDNEGNMQEVSSVGEEKADMELISIPIQYRNKMLGVYSIAVDKAHHPKIEDEHELLLSIGQHLGMAIEKAHVDDESRLLSIMEERTRMAHELHDSLAQTLASMRYKVRLLDDSLHTSEDEAIWSELEGLEGIIDDANTELRSLITHFRAPIDGKGIVRAVERLANRFEMETSIEVFFYQNWHLFCIPRDVEIEAVRIVQEALANIRKHSQAETVRILMYGAEDGQCRILVEDDGVGFNDQLFESDEFISDHFGLTVMRERAERINGEIQLESDEGEGTLVQLSFNVPPEPMESTS